MENFLTSSMTGCSLLNAFSVESTGKTQYTRRWRQRCRRKTQEEEEEEEEPSSDNDYTDEQSKAIVNELYKIDTGGGTSNNNTSGSVEVPPPLLQQNFSIKRGGGIHGNTTPVYLVSTPGWSGRERILSMQRYVGSYKSLVNDATLLKTPAPWQISENPELFLYTRREAARHLTVDLNRTINIPIQGAGEQIAISIKGTQNPFIVLPVAANKPNWVAVTRSYLELLLLFVNCHGIESDAQPVKFASQQNTDERNRINQGGGLRKRQMRESAKMDLSNSQRRKEIASLRPHFYYLLLRFIQKLDEHVGYTFFNPYAICHCAAKKDSAWTVRNRLFNLSYMGDSFSRETSLVADLLKGPGESKVLKAFAYSVKYGINFRFIYGPTSVAMQQYQQQQQQQQDEEDYSDDDYDESVLYNMNPEEFFIHHIVKRIRRVDGSPPTNETSRMLVDVAHFVRIHMFPDYISNLDSSRNHTSALVNLRVCINQIFHKHQFGLMFALLQHIQLNVRTLINYNAFRVMAHKLFYPVLTGLFYRNSSMFETISEMSHFEESMKTMNRSVPFKVALEMGTQEGINTNHGDFPETLRQNQVVNNTMTAGRYTIHNSSSCATSGGFSEKASLSVDMTAVRGRKDLSKPIYEKAEENIMKAKENDFNRYVKRLTRKNAIKRNQNKKRMHLTKESLEIFNDSKRKGLLRNHCCNKKKKKKKDHEISEDDDDENESGESDEENDDEAATIVTEDGEAEEEEEEEEVATDMEQNQESEEVEDEATASTSSSAAPAAATTTSAKYRKKIKRAEKVAEREREEQHSEKYILKQLRSLMLTVPKERITNGKQFGTWDDDDYKLYMQTVMAVIKSIDVMPRDIYNAISKRHKDDQFEEAYAIARGYLDFVDKRLNPGEIGELLANEEYEQNPMGVVFRKNVKFYNYKEEEVEIEYKQLQTLLSKKFNPQELDDYTRVSAILTIFEYGKAIPGTLLNSLQITPSKPYPKNPQSLPLDGALGDCGRDGEPKLVSNSKAVYEALCKTGRNGLDYAPSTEDCQALETAMKEWKVGLRNLSSSETFTMDEDIMKMLSNFLEDAPPFEHFSAGDSKMEMQLNNHVIISCLMKNPLYLAFLTAENQIHRILLLKNLISYLNIAIAGLVAVDLPKSLITSKGSKNSGATKSVLKEAFYYRTAGEDRNGLKDAVYPKCIVNLTSVQGKTSTQKCSHTFCTMMRQLMVSLRPSQATAFLSDERSEKNLLNLYKKLCSSAYCSGFRRKARKERKSDIFELLTVPPSNFKDFGGRVELPTESFHDKVLRLVKIKDCCGQHQSSPQGGAGGGASGAGYKDDDVPDFHQLFLPTQAEDIGPLETADTTVGEPIRATATELRQQTVWKAMKGVTLEDIMIDSGILPQQQQQQQQQQPQENELFNAIDEYMNPHPEYQQQQQLSKKRKQDESVLQSKVAKVQHQSSSINEDGGESLKPSMCEANTSQYPILLTKVDVTATNPSLGGYSSLTSVTAPHPTTSTTPRTRTGSMPLLHISAANDTELMRIQRSSFPTISKGKSSKNQRPKSSSKAAVASSASPSPGPFYHLHHHHRQQEQQYQQQQQQQQQQHQQQSQQDINLQSPTTILLEDDIAGDITTDVGAINVLKMIGFNKNINHNAWLEEQ